MTVAEAKELFTRLTEEGKGDYEVIYECLCESCQPENVSISDKHKAVDIS